MNRTLEPEPMDDPAEVDAYAAADFGEVNARFVGRVIELVGGTHRRLDVLDLGCGPGDITSAIAAALPAARVVGADASEPMLVLARARAAQVTNLRFELADAKALPSTLGLFDLIVSNSLLHHLPDPAGLWRSFRRVARPGAFILLRDLARPASEAEARDIVRRHAGGESKLLQQEYYRSLLAAFTPVEVRQQLAEAGLDDLAVQMISDRHFDVVGRL